MAQSVGDEPSENCCILYTEENYSGISKEYCRKSNFLGQIAPTSAYSFVDNDDSNVMDANFESYKCGSRVEVDFCYSVPQDDWVRDESGALGIDWMC